MPDEHDATNDELPVPTEEAGLPARSDRSTGAETARWAMNQLVSCIQVDEELDAKLESDSWTVVASPPEEASKDVLTAGEKLARTIHEEFDRVSIEIHSDPLDGIEFHYVVRDRDLADRIRQLIISAYPSVEIDIKRSVLPIETGDMVSVDRVEYDADYLLPLKHAESAVAPAGDPLGGVLDTLGDARHSRCMIQTVVEPISRDWTTRWSRGHPHRPDDHRWWKLPPTRHSRVPAMEFLLPITVMTAAGWFAVTRWYAIGGLPVTVLFTGLGMILAAAWWSALFGDFGFPHRQTAAEAAQALRDHDWDEARATPEERQAADTIASQESEPGFRVTQRVVIAGRDEDKMRTLRRQVRSQLRSAFGDPHTGQQLRFKPLRRLSKVLDRVAGRVPRRRPLKHAKDKLATRSVRRTPMFMSVHELAAVACHLPDSTSVTKGAIDWAAPRVRTPLPPSALRYQRPGWTEPSPPRHSPLARAGRMALKRLPAPLVDRLADRGIETEQESEEPAAAALPEWVTPEEELAIEVDHRESGLHEQYGEVETKLLKDGDPTTPEDSGGAWMGSFLREIIESKQKHPRGDMLIGYQEQGGVVREALVPFDVLFTHALIQGLTGAGKSTLAGVLLAQWAYAGFGFAVPDPSGELVADIIRWLPDHRKDDVVWYQPEPDVANKIVGLNPLSIPQEPGDDGFGRAVDLAVDEVENGLRTKEGEWGPRMIGICRNLARVMISSEKEFTLVDLHSALVSEEGRKKIAERAGKTDEWVARYTRKIAELDEKDLDALIRRLNEWVESTVARSTVAIKDSTLDLEEIVQEEKILLFDNKLSNSGLARMLATIVWSRIWNICRRRPKGERTPFCILADEFDDFITPNMDVPMQVRNARKYKLSLILMTQYLGAIGYEDVQEALDEECKTNITLRLQGESGSDAAKDLGLEEEYVKNLTQYHALIEIQIDGDPRGPFEITLPAPVAPVRSAEEAQEEIVEPALDRYGREPLTDAEIHEQQELGGDGRFTSTDEDGNVVEDDPVEVSEDRRRAILKAIHDETLIRGQEGDGVRLKNAADRIRRLHDRGEELADQSLATVLNRLPSSDIERWEDEDGDLWVRTVDDTAIYDTGRSGSSGKWGHDQILRDAYGTLTKAGFTVEIENQSGDEQGDGTAAVDASIVDDDGVEWSKLSKPDRRTMTASIVEEHPELIHLLLGDDAPLSDDLDGDEGPPPTEVHALRQRDLEVTLEAEKSTGGTKGGYTCRNVAKAANSRKRCLLLCRPDTASSVWNTLTSPPFVSDRGVPDGHSERYYNLDNLTIYEETMLRPERPGDGQDHTIWSRDDETDEIVLSDSSGTEHARFGDADAVFSGARGYPRTIPAEQISDSSDIPSGFKAVKKPFIPEWEFNSGELPDQNDWEIVIVPGDAEEPTDLAVYRNGETISLDEIEDHSKADKARREILERFGHNDD